MSAADFGRRTPECGLAKLDTCIACEKRTHSAHEVMLRTGTEAGCDIALLE